MPNMKLMFTKKIGPLPAWGWGLVVGGGYLGYRLLSGRGLSLSGASTSSDTTMAAPGESGSYAGPSEATGGGAFGYNVPDIIVNLIPTVGTGNNGTSKSKQTTRTNKWRLWGIHWRDQAFKNAGNNPKKEHATRVPVEAHKKSTVHKDTKLRGTQGTQVVKKLPTAAPQRMQKKTVGRGK